MGKQTKHKTMLPTTPRPGFEWLIGAESLEDKSIRYDFICTSLPTPTPNIVKQCSDDDDITIIASNYASNSDDSVATITQPTSGSDTEEESLYVKAIPIEVINCNYNNNQYAELACFADEDEEEDCEWDCTQSIIPKPILLATNRAQAWKQLTTTKLQL